MSYKYTSFQETVEYKNACTELESFITSHGGTKIDGVKWIAQLTPTQLANLFQKIQKIELLNLVHDHLLFAIDYIADYFDANRTNVFRYEGSNYKVDIRDWRNQMHMVYNDRVIELAPDQLVRQLQAQTDFLQKKIFMYGINAYSNENYRKENESLKDTVEQQKKQIEQLEAEVASLKLLDTEDTFVERVVKETKRQFKHRRNEAESIRLILERLGHKEAEQELDTWIEGREKSATTTENHQIFNAGSTAQFIGDHGTGIARVGAYHESATNKQ